nr:GNVR domain-containing protein [Mesorhizobium sp. L-8-3]
MSNDGRDRRRRAGSLLSFGNATPEERGGDRPGPQPRRDAGQSPLLAALAEADRRAAEEVAAKAEPAPRQSDRKIEPVSRAPTLRERLLGRPPSSGWGSEADEPARESAAPAPAPQPMPAAAQPRMADEPSNERYASRLIEERDEEIWRPLIDPMKVIMGIVNARRLIAATTVLGALLGIAVALSTPKKYEAVAEILFDPRDLKLVDRELTQSGLPSDATLALVENQVRVITSGSVLNKVVDKLNLADDPEFNGQGSGGLGSVYSELRSLLSRSDATAAGDRKRRLAVENLAESLSVERGGKTFVIVVAAKTRDPEKSALIANTVTDVFLQTSGELQAGTAGRAAEELNARLDELRSGVEAAERKAEAYRAENDLIDAQGRLITDDEILRLNDQLAVARARTLELNARAASGKDIDVNDAIGGGLPEEMNSNVMTELRSQYAALKAEADRLAVRLGPRHPDRIAAEAQLDGARGRIANELRRIVASNQTELRRAVQLEQELSTRLAQLKVRQGTVSDDLVTLRELERDAAAKRAVYEAFLLRARETGEQKDINTANMSVISRALAPLTPLGPSRSMIVLAGALLGFMAGVGLGGARGAWQSLRENTAIRPRPNRPIPPADGAAQGGLPPGPPDPRDPGPPGPGPVEPVRERPVPNSGETSRVAARRSGAAGDGRPSGWLQAFRRANLDRGQPVAAPAPWFPPKPQPVAPARQFVSQAMAQAQPFPSQPVAYAQPLVATYPATLAYPATQPWTQPMPMEPVAYPHAYSAQVAPQPSAKSAARSSHHTAGDPWPVAAPNGIDEIRDSLRDFREALHDLAESRARRRAG